MNKILNILAIVLLAACGGLAPDKIEAPPDAAPQYSEVQRASVVGIYCGDRASGSGVIVGVHEALTAYHVVDDCMTEIQIELSDGLRYPAFARMMLEESDLVLLEVAVTLPDLRLEWGPRPVPGDIVCHESALPMATRACGKVLAVSNRKGGDILHLAVTIPGNSGSGAYDSRGRLVGIVTMTWRSQKRSGGLHVSLAEHRLCLLESRCV